MSNVSAATNFFPKAEENSVAMTLGGSILAGAATVPVNNMTNYTDGDVVAFTVDPATPSLKQVFTGTKSGSNIINAVWTEVPTGGSNVPHAAGATVIDYVSATHWDLLQKGITSSLNQDGSMKTSAVQTALNITTPATAGWVASGFAPSAVVANGNRSYTLTFSAANLTTTMSPGMRLQTTRTVAAPTQCTSLNGTTQYYSKTSPAGMTFTNNFVVSAWVKLTQYGAVSTIASRYNGTSGWQFQVQTDGRLQLIAENAGAANSSYVISYQSIPLNKWVHVAGQLDMATFTATTTTSYLMMDGVDIPASVNRGGTNPTALIQAGNLEVGSQNAGTLPFNGKIAQVAIYSAKVTEANVLATISQGLAGTETSLISAYSFNNTINDLNANANNLTANGSAVATNADSPFGGQADGTISSTLDYGIITKTAFSTNTTLTVQVPEGCTIPTSGGVSAVSYSTVGVPYGFPKQRGKWRIETLFKTAATIASPVSGTWNNQNMVLNVPIGEWMIGYQLNVYLDKGGGATLDYSTSLSTANNAESDAELTSYCVTGTAATYLAACQTREKGISASVATPYYAIQKTNAASLTNLKILGADPTGTSRTYIECAYL